MYFVEAYRRLARRRAWSCLLVALVALLGRAAMMPRWHIPLAGVHDEFSYLLAADTYAAGRLTNPPHPMWEHFETFHVLQQPTYMSKYPPLQGLALAFGERFFGQPWIGVWLSMGLMCAAVCWMLQGWIDPEWALLGGLMLATRVGVVSYWMNSYWGGAIAAAGGALILGAAPRFARERRLRDALIFAAGILIVLNSRPFEGFVAGVLAAIALLWWLRAGHISWKPLLARRVAPAMLVLALGAAGMAYQNYRVTGNALLTPYVAHDRQYAAASLFLWSTKQAVPVYRHAVLKQYWADWQAGAIREARSDVFGEFFRKLGSLNGFYFDLWPVLAVVLIWPFRLASREERWTAGILAAYLVITVAPLAGILPHYSAPIAALLYLRLMQAFCRLPGWKLRGLPVGGLLLAGLLAAWGVKTGYYMSQPQQAPKVGWERTGVLRQIERTPGDHLVIVHYGANHSPHDEWVYNGADIDHARVVWAREMGPAKDAELVQYFRQRQVWRVDADASPPRLEPYSGHAD